MATTNYRIPLSHQAELAVWFLTDRGRITSYAVVLLARQHDHLEPVRVYDNAHHQNEMHRHTRTGGKQPAETVLPGDFGTAMRTAINEILDGYENMVQAWRQRTPPTT